MSSFYIGAPPRHRLPLGVHVAHGHSEEKIVGAGEGGGASKERGGDKDSGVTSGPLRDRSRPVLRKLRPRKSNIV